MTTKDKQYEKRKMIESLRNSIARARKLNDVGAPMRQQTLSEAITCMETGSLWLEQVKTDDEKGPLDF